MRSGLARAIRNLAGGPPVPLSDGALYRLPVFSMSGNDTETYLRAYGQVGTVYSIVSLLASATARCEWHLYRKQPTDARRRYAQTDSEVDQRVEVVNHAALSLIQKPNDFMTRLRLFELDQAYSDLAGEAYWVIGRQGVTFPTSLWPVRPDRMEPVADPGKYISGWIYTSPDGHQQIPLGTDEVIQFAYPNPLDPMHGLGPVQSILLDINAAQYSSQWNRNFFLNSARPDGVITVPNKMTDPEFKTFTARWRESHRGMARAHQVAVLENGASWQGTDTSPKDMDFTGLRQLDRDLIREAFRMHRIMLGTTDDVNRANAQTGEEIFSSWEVVPRLDRKKDVLNNVFLPMFGSTGQGVEFDYVRPIPPNREEDRQELVAKAQAVSLLVTAGYDPHDVLELIGWPDMGVAEKATQLPAVPPGWVPGMPAPLPGAPAGPAPVPGDDLAAQLARLLHNVRGRDLAAWNLTGSRR